MILNWVGFAVGVAGVLLSIWFYVRQRTPKALDYRLLIHQPILIGVARDRLEVLSRNTGVVVEDPHLLAIRVGNTGKKEILRSDFERPLRLLLDPPTRILSSDVTRSHPSNLSVATTIGEGGQSVTIEPTLLNPGDSFDLQIITNGAPRRTGLLEGRVAGLRMIGDLSTIERRRYERPDRSGRLLLAILVLVIVGFAVGQWNNGLQAVIVTVGAILAFLALIVGGTRLLQLRDDRVAARTLETAPPQGDESTSPS